jgi:hypothetical protein
MGIFLWAERIVNESGRPFACTNQLLNEGSALSLGFSPFMWGLCSSALNKFNIYESHTHPRHLVTSLRNEKIRELDVKA